MHQSFQPTFTHAFIRLLQDKGLLLRDYTQNIDSLERVVGIRDDLLVQTHGSIESCCCVACNEKYSMKYVELCLAKGVIPHCKCGGLVKPGIVFFGEKLPLKFTWYSKRDLGTCDLLLVLGTSLSVEPMASLVEYVRSSTPRVLINRERVGPFRFCGMSSCYRDVCYIGDCDEGVRELCSLLGWEGEVEAILRSTAPADFPRELPIFAETGSSTAINHCHSAPVLYEATDAPNESSNE